jgi:Fur family peroxide stress response transcriptional regulator
MDPIDGVEILRRAGLRSTPQRQAIVRVVMAANHPTVAQVYDEVRREFPTIGLATVYNTLHTMTERGVVRELPFVNATRFDGNVEPHANLVCRSCGTIYDSSACDDLMEQLRRRVASEQGFLPEMERIDVYGLCSACAPAAK